MDKIVNLYRVLALSKDALNSCYSGVAFVRGVLEERIELTGERHGLLFRLELILFKTSFNGRNTFIFAAEFTDIPLNHVKKV